jgi:hypothetical protein
VDDARFIGSREWGLCAPPGDIPPPSWTCYDDWYWDHDDVDGGCDCGCGAPDPDCFGDTTEAACDYCFNAYQDPDIGVYDDQGSCALLDTCEDIQDFDNALCHRCDASPCPAPSQTPPVGWTCVDSYWLDGFCDCGCGAYDPECPSSVGTTFEFTSCECWSGSCGHDGGLNRCANLDPSDNSQCL